MERHLLRGPALCRDPNLLMLPFLACLENIAVLWMLQKGMSKFYIRVQWMYETNSPILKGTSSSSGLATLPRSVALPFCLRSSPCSEHRLRAMCCLSQRDDGSLSRDSRTLVRAWNDLAHDEGD